MITLTDIQAAQERLAGRVHRTPVMTSRTFDEITGRRVFFKCENFQRAGAFKMRGATNKICSLTADERRNGVVAFSSGNHAQAVALAAREAGLRAVIVMPADAPQAKLTATRGYGAEVVLFDRQREDREAVAREVVARTGGVLVPPYDDYAVIAGQGTTGLELLAEVPDLDTVIAPCSGGGLFAGVSIAAHGVRSAIRCYAVEPDTADDTRQSWLTGERVMTVPPSATIADGLRTQTPGRLTFPLLQQHAADVLTVTEAEIMAAMRFLLLRLKILVEPSGAVGAAALLAGKLPTDCRRVGVILSGGNVDANLLAAVCAVAD